ncbi:uncharacterized protein LOC125497684 [Beta vulgaris subsp. vulgaris]|uniref:uncharacterized protein LOC125497684 n=1 Tax=Beta vulgaris subsp. vulgaris TaxID=3555 RepID=UPI002036E397|nr:uncharacterized protein LOC125497684 [Beta vulgaris subsp. vulgaris]
MREILSSEREKTLSSEENDILQRSNKKFKRHIDDSQGNVEMEIQPSPVVPARKSYSQMAQSYGKAVNPLYEGGEDEDDCFSDEDRTSDNENDDESCPNIVLSKEDKRRIRSPWKNAIIIKLFDKKMGYEALMRRLKFKWSLKGNIALTDVGHAFYVVRFTSYEDYEFVMTQGPWMIGDSYLTIRKWVPNFIANEALMRHLTAWVRIPNLFVEYFDKQILFKIGEKIGKVIKIDRNTESMDRGQYVRFCIEVDLAKPLLPKFKLNRRIWRIQYEGLRMICFKRGHLGHKEDSCGKAPELRDAGTIAHGVKSDHIQAPNVAQCQGPEVHNKYGEWMMVAKPNRRSSNKNTVENKGKEATPMRGIGGAGRSLNFPKQKNSSSATVQNSEGPVG